MGYMKQALVSGGNYDSARLALIGCSYEDFCGVKSLGTSTYLQQTGYASWAQVATGVLTLDNYGISGQSTAQVCDRVDAALAATTAGIALIGGGMENDVQTLYSATAAAAVARANADAALLIAAYAKVKASGRRLITRTCSNRKGLVSAPQKQYMATASKLIRSWSAQNGVPCLDMQAIVTNPSTGIACLSGEYGWDADAIDDDTTHLSGTGAVVVGGVLTDIVQQMIPASVYGPPGYSQDLYSTTVPDGNFVANPKMIGTGGTAAGGATGDVATGWTLTATAVPGGGSIVGAKVTDARPASRGEWQQITMSGSSAGTAQLWRAGFISGLVGRTMEMSCDVQADADGWAAGGIGTCYQLSLSFYDDAYATVGYSKVFPEIAKQPKTKCPDGRLSIRPVNVPVGATSWILSCRLFGVGVVRFSNVDCRLY